jgi:hypothetical protein
VKNVKILYDVTHTSHCRVTSGIQRVVRRVWQHWPARDELVPIVFDPWLGDWRFANAKETRFLQKDLPPADTRKRRAVWTLPEKVRGVARRLLPLPVALKNPLHARRQCFHALLVPELFADKRDFALYERLNPLIAAGTGAQKFAIFYDLIPVLVPQFSEETYRRRFAAYVEDLRRFDVILADSEFAAKTLDDYWRAAGASPVPRIRAIPLGVDAPPQPDALRGDAGETAWQEEHDEREQSAQND